MVLDLNSKRVKILTTLTLFGVGLIVAGIISLSLESDNANQSKYQIISIDASTLTKSIEVKAEQKLSNATKLHDDSLKPISKKTDEDLAQNHKADALVKKEQPVIEKKKWLKNTVMEGNTLTSIFKKNGFSAQDAFLLASSSAGKVLQNIRPGQNINLLQDPNNISQLNQLEYVVSDLKSILIKHKNGKFTTHEIEKKPEIALQYREVKIKTTLLQAASEASIPDQIIYKIASIYGWKIDFARDIRKNDQLAVIYEELFINEKKIGYGNILIAKLVNNKKAIIAVHHVEESGDQQYYTPEGENLRGAFLKSPLEFAYVTSNFSPRRFHPVKKVWKAHRGVDYRAKIGTKVLATSDGVVSFVGQKTGYGKVVILRHGKKYETLYGHLSRFGKGVKKHKKVKQGQVIAYSGNTGWSTGPHLHYEFRENGVHRNPLTVKLPPAESIKKENREEFIATAKKLITQIETFSSPSLAKIDVDSSTISE